MSLQVIGIKTWEFLVIMGPSILITIGLILIFLLGRFIGHYEEQKNIIKNLPNIIQEEIDKAYKQINELKKKLALTEKLYDALKIAASFAITRALAIARGLQEGFTGKVLEISDERKTK